MHRPLRIAIFGTGFIGRLHLEGLCRLGAAVQVCALASAELEQAHRLGAEFGITRIVSDYRELLADPLLDAVHVCTPNALHWSMAMDALRAGKHILCEKPLGTSVGQAREMVQLAQDRGLRNCICHNLRFYPLVQQMRRMCQDGDLGEILVVQGTYSQDWLLLDTDWNWRMDSNQSGPSRAMADIGSHWCDLAEYVTGQQIIALCADLQTFHRTRKRPRQCGATFAAKAANTVGYEEVPIDTEDFGAVIFRMKERTRGSFTVSQMAAGRKNRLNIEINGSKLSVAWDAESPDQLWVGHRDAHNQLTLKDPILMKRGPDSYADLPGGHAEGFDSTFKRMFRRFYESVANLEAEPDYPQFVDGLRQMVIVEAELASSRNHAWVDCL
jgi:predicted dehydrogenase